jgi:hypothetical protein
VFIILGTTTAGCAIWYLLGYWRKQRQTRHEAASEGGTQSIAPYSLPPGLDRDEFEIINLNDMEDGKDSK